MRYIKMAMNDLMTNEEIREYNELRRNNPKGKKVKRKKTPWVITELVDGKMVEKITWL